MKIGDTPRVHGRHLWYCDYGGGKTYLLGLLHRYLVDKEGSRGLYLFDFDIGTNTLRSAEKFDDMEFDYYTGEGAYHRFETKLAALSEDSEGFGGLAIDSLTTLEKVVMKHIKTVVAPNTKRPMGGMIANEQDYGCLVQVIENILPFLQAVSLKMEVVMTAHMQERRNEETHVLWNLPSVTGKKLPSKIGAYFNEVWHIEATKKDKIIERIAQTATFDRFKCKTQIKGMPFTLDVEEALALAIKAYGVGAVLTKDEADAQAQAVVAAQGGTPSPLGIEEKKEDEKIEGAEPTREEMIKMEKS